jgi:hypothetical protein
LIRPIKSLPRSIAVPGMFVARLRCVSFGSSAHGRCWPQCVSPDQKGAAKHGRALDVRRSLALHVIRPPARPCALHRLRVTDMPRGRARDEKG